MTPKILIVTDERTGCTEFTDYFTVFRLVTRHDPYTALSCTDHPEHEDLSRVTRHNHIEDIETIYTRLFLAYDVIKICFISHTIEQLQQILTLVNELGVHILFIHKDPYKRALSKSIAVNLTIQCHQKNIYDISGYSNDVSSSYTEFNINIDDIISYVQDYINKLENTLQFVESKNLKYSLLELNYLYRDPSYMKVAEIFQVFGLHIDENMYAILHDKIKNFHVKDKKIYVKNLKELDQLFDFQYHLELPKINNCVYTNLPYIVD